MILSRRTSLPLLYYCAASITPRTSAFSRTMTSSTASKANSFLGKTLVSVPEAINLHDDNENSSVKFIDGSWWLGKDRDGRREFERGPRIAKAKYLDIDDISTKTPDNLPHMMPSSSLQSAAMDAMGIAKSDHVIVYGKKDCMFVTRAYMQMRIMGHPREFCHLMNGSLDEWIDAGGPIEAEETTPSHPVIDAENLREASSYTATNPQNIIDMKQLKTIIAEGKNMGENPSVLVVDARSAGRFSGIEPEPRPGLRGGHMPGAINLPITDLLDPSDKVRLKSKEELQQIIQEAGIPLPLSPSGSKIVSSCGSGVTACALLTAFDILGEDTSNVYLYDGAWIQWGGQSDTPIV
uniref:Rhodanese domain-containing protein n=1 Tax=Pseudo-nitzschia australis TaxID=44445 RepID=A0A7S4AWY3_9STRA|mmetsp:Transcript_24856/g.54591  ORF Transcript_24856/g.54591 Transcript_24856/m.54591 type:complete len:351 (+) Transcript_24856:51-1103(+)